MGMPIYGKVINYKYNLNGDLNIYYESGKIEHIKSYDISEYVREVYPRYIENECR